MFITRADLVRRTGVHRETLARWIVEGLLVPVQSAPIMLFDDAAVFVVRRLRRQRARRWHSVADEVVIATLPDLLTNEQAAAVLGCSLATVHRLKRDGTLTRHVEGRRVRLSRAEVLALLDR